MARTQAATPIGTLTKKIQCQVSRSVSTPPASRPIEAPADATNEKTPIAFACSPGSGNIVTIIPRITAEASAPPTPWTKRAAISISGLTDSPHSSEARVKTARPARKTVRRPIRSPSRPASSSRPPNAIRYALTTHASPAAENPRSSWIVGRATFTIVWSRMIISIPAHRTTRASQRESRVRVVMGVASCSHRRYRSR